MPEHPSASADIEPLPFPCLCPSIAAPSPEAVGPRKATAKQRSAELREVLGF